MKNDTLTYTMGYNGDTLSSVAKNNQSLAEFTIEEALLGEKETVNEYYPSSANPMFTVSRKYDIYDRIVEIDDLIKNTYDIGAFFIDGTYTTVGIDNGSAKLAVREDLITGIQTKFAYQNNRLERVGEFNFQGTTVNEETFTYDESGKLVEDKFTYDSGTNSVQHNITYVSEGGSNNSEGMISSYSYKVNGTQKAKTENTYDAYKRVTNKKYTVGGRVFNRGVEYDKTRVNKVIDSVAGTTLYEYDSMGRICQEKDVNNTIIRNYTYDDYGQLIREDNKTLDKTFVYEYNNIGNIVNVKTYDYTTGLLGDVISQQNFGYDTTNTDRLTNFAGTTVSYNSMGCPTTYNGHTVSWTRGKISKLSKGLKLSGIDNYYYSYNALGQRTDRSYTYTLPTLGASSVAMGTLIGYSQAFDYDQSGRLISESKSYQYYGESGSSDKIVYLYDANSIIGMIYTLDGATNVYYFQRNLFGDVIGIYDTNGTKVGGYAYDAWGNCTITLNTNGIATRNPIRYRGYYYDEDTKLYYLNARYYCPEWRRFISPDDTGYLDPESVNGLNLYAYCNNDPVNYADPSGCAIETIWDVASLVVSALEVAANPCDVWAWAGLLGDVVDVVIPFVGGIGESVDVARTVYKIYDTSDDIIDAAKNARRMANAADDLKDATGTYVILYAKGQNYIGKGGFGRAIQSAAEHLTDTNKVKAIIWAPTTNKTSAFVAEYLMQSTLGLHKAYDNSFNLIWSPGRKLFKNLFN